jgi:hypothetical protein
MRWECRSCAPAIHWQPQKSKGYQGEDQGEEDIQMGKKCLYMDYSQMEVNKKGENGMVMNDKGDGIDRIIGVEKVKIG